MTGFGVRMGPDLAQCEHIASDRKIVAERQV